MSIPLFLKDESNEFHIISSHNKEVAETIEKGSKLVYLGKRIDDKTLQTNE